MKKYLTGILSVFMVLAMLFGSVGMLIQNANAYSYIATGIDVSAWQGTINWTSVKSSGIDFAILRIMASGKDRCFESNYTNGKAAGVKLGVYCYSYATTVAGAQAEANKVLNWLGGRTLEYPIYYDIEDSCQASLTTAQRTQLCIAFCDTIEAAGYRAGIYSGASWFNTKLDSATLSAKYEIWEAMWPTSNGVQVNSPIYDRSARCGMWQYSSTGSVSGISGRVDMNVSYKDYAAYMIANGYNGYGSAGVTAVTSSTCAPAGYGWKWPSSEAYGYIGNYGGNGQDIELCVDLCLLPSSAASEAVFYTNGTSSSMKISQSAVTVGSTSVAYSWGELSLDNWHDVKFKILDGKGYVFIDGKLIAYGSDITANEAYQLLFSYTGEMAIDNLVMMNSSGATYFTCDFEDASLSQTLMGEGLGHRALLTGVEAVTDSACAPAGNGWIWPSSEAYGYIGNYGGNGQDIELCADLCLLPSSAASEAVFYTDGTSKSMKISQSAVTVGSTTVAYNWGTLGLDNWHDVKFKIYGGTGYVFIDGELIASESGITANEEYQLLFSYSGEMAIDNLVMMDSSGTAYLTCDFETGSTAQTLMGEGLGHRGALFDVPTVTPDTCAPAKYGWTWPQAEAYGYMGNYGGNGQDIELCVDLCLLPSENSDPPIARFYTDEGAKWMDIAPTYVTVGSTKVSYSWGELSLDNWHDVKFKVLNGTGYVFIDGELIASEAGFNTIQEYTLLFSYTGKMAVDNVILMDSTGNTYFNCDFEDEGVAEKLMGEGLGARTLLLPDESDFTVSVSSSADTITGTGTVTYTATPSAGENHTYKWTSSNSALNSYLSGTTSNTLTVNIPAELTSSISATLTCTVTSDGGIVKSGSASFTYNTIPAPTINAITPSTATVTGTGTATYTVTASGDGLSYKWTSSNSALNSYLSGTTSATLVVNIPAELSAALTSTLTCTVTNSYGKSAQKTAAFNYALAPVPTISAISPATATITGTGSATFTATASGDGLTYKWTSSNAAIDAYLSGTDTATLTVNIPEELSASLSATLTCTVTNSYGKSVSADATVSYMAIEGPALSIITPSLVTVTGTGTATFTATAEGTDITYCWTSSDEALNAYMSGTDTAVLTVNITEELASEFSATLTCTVTDSNGKTAQKTARLAYKLTPVPVIESITPDSATLEGAGTVTFTATATGDGLTYEWTSSDDALSAYLSGADTDTLTITIPQGVTEDMAATITLTVTNSYGRTATAECTLEYLADLDSGSDIVMTGDLDGDGSISAKDTNMLRRIVSGVLVASADQIAAGDINGDGVINGLDSNLLTKMAAGN